MRAADCRHVRNTIMTQHMRNTSHLARAPGGEKHPNYARDGRTDPLISRQRTGVLNVNDWSGVLVANEQMPR
jgi:hypothetical protein